MNGETGGLDVHPYGCDARGFGLGGCATKKKGGSDGTLADQGQGDLSGTWSWAVGNSVQSFKMSCWKEKSLRGPTRFISKSIL